jgi:hypothetical protein
MPDKHIAERFHVRHQDVSRFRLKKGLPPVHHAPAQAKVLAQKERLGKESDLSLSKELGVPFQTVAEVRKKLGIAPYMTMMSREESLAHQNELMELAAEGRNMMEMAELTNKHHSAIAATCKRLGIETARTSRRHKKAV